MAVKFTKGQICNGTISKIICHKEYNLHGKFHTCFTKCTIFALRRSTIYKSQQDFRLKIPRFYNEISVRLQTLSWLFHFLLRVYQPLSALVT